MKPYKSLLFLVVLIPVMAQANDTTRISHRFADKTIHSFSIQYNNCFYPKATFDYKGDWPKILEPKSDINGNGCSIIILSSLPEWVFQ